MKSPVDILLTEDRSWKVADDGDLAVATKQDVIDQDIVVRLFNQTYPARGEGVTALFVEEFESDIEAALRRSEYVDSPYDVNVVDVEDGKLTVNVSTAEMEFPIEVDTSE